MPSHKNPLLDPVGHMMVYLAYLFDVLGEALADPTGGNKKWYGTPLFTSQTTGEQIKEDTHRTIFKTTFLGIGLTDFDCLTHMCRKTTGFLLRLAGIQLPDVADYMGWNETEMTKRYVPCKNPACLLALAGLEQNLKKVFLWHRQVQPPQELRDLCFQKFAEDSKNPGHFLSAQEVYAEMHSHNLAARTNPELKLSVDTAMEHL